MVWRTPALNTVLRQLAAAAGGLVILQVLLGVATLKLRLQVEPLTVLHQAIGALLLGVLVAFTVLALRDASASVVSAMPSVLVEDSGYEAPANEQPA
jgi:cytochrome c oxidase assembly protein subunit 15